MHYSNVLISDYMNGRRIIGDLVHSFGCCLDICITNQLQFTVHQDDGICNFKKTSHAL